MYRPCPNSALTDPENKLCAFGPVLEFAVIWQEAGLILLLCGFIVVSLAPHCTQDAPCDGSCVLLGLFVLACVMLPCAGHESDWKLGSVAGGKRLSKHVERVQEG